MSFNAAPWDSSQEPNVSNVSQWLMSIYTRAQPYAQATWNEANIDTAFYSGNQSYVNNYFGMNNSQNNKFYFNISQTPIQMVTGYQRQHRKQINYIPGDGADTDTTDQYNKLMTHACNTGGIHEQYSRACEQSCVSGMVLLQPYLDFTGTDPAQGTLKAKIWEYNSFLADPFARELDFSDANYVWCQEYISRQDAEERFPGVKMPSAPTKGNTNGYGQFYFLPENYTMQRNDLLVLSYVWYKWKRKKKMLYSPEMNQFFDLAQDANIDGLLYNIPDLQEVEIEVPTWKVAVILNDRLMFQGNNPLGFDECPVVPVVWNYEPYNNSPNLRVRGLMRSMRSPQYLLNRRINLNMDNAEATITAGYKRKVGAVANEENLKRTNGGFDILINDDYELSDVEKILPNEIPQSNIMMGDQLKGLVFDVSGVNLESWTAQNSPNASSLTVLMKQAANLMVLQKFFDQWDLALKTIGNLMLKIVLNNWSAQKVRLIISEEPSPFFYSKVFANYQCVVEEGILTPTQAYQEYQAWLELNQQLNGVIPPDMLAKKAPIQGKTELMKILAQQSQQQQAVAAEEQNIKHAYDSAQLQELYSKAAANLAMAKERAARSDSNVGLFEERLSEISRNRALATKDKMEALKTLIEATRSIGQFETDMKMSELNQMSYQQEINEDREKMDARQTEVGNEFTQQIMGQMNKNNAQQAMNPTPAPEGIPPMGV